METERSAERAVPHAACAGASSAMADEQFASRDQAIVLTVDQTATMLQLGRNTVYALVEQGVVPHIRLGKSIRIPRWGLMQYIARVSGAPLLDGPDVALPPTPSVHVGRSDAREV